MKQTVYLGDFRDAFHRMDRGTQFSYEGLGVLYDYLEEVDPDFELDVIALCCDFSEMDVDEVISTYGLEDDVEDMDEADKHAFVSDFLNDRTVICGEVSPNGYVFQDF